MAENSENSTGFNQFAAEWFDPEQLLDVTQKKRTQHMSTGEDLSSLPESKASDVEKDYAAPRTPTEEKLAEIWGGLLKLERVSIHDDFFEVGGHSLSATQLLSQICEAFSVELPMRVFFTNSSGRITIADLARIVEESQLQQLDNEDVNSALKMLEGLSEEEIDRLLKDG